MDTRVRVWTNLEVWTKGYQRARCFFSSTVRHLYASSLLAFVVPMVPLMVIATLLSDTATVKRQQSGLSKVASDPAKWPQIHEAHEFEMVQRYLFR